MRSAAAQALTMACALAWAITEHIANKIKCRTLFATHYHELTELAELFANVKNCNVAVREWMDEVVFLHKILPGGTDKSYGIHVAKLAGVPQSILERSKEILEELESTFTKEVTSDRLAKHKTKQPDKDTLFVQKHKSVLEKLSSMDVNNLTPIEAINLLSQIRDEINGRQRTRRRTEDRQMSERIESFRDLNVYKLAIELQQEIYELTKRFPKEEIYSLTDQIRRSSRSIGANIAEAWQKRRYPAHFVSKLSDADGEQAETQHWLDTSLKCKYLSSKEHGVLLQKCKKIGAMLGKMMAEPKSFCARFSTT